MPSPTTSEKSLAMSLRKLLPIFLVNENNILDVPFEVACNTNSSLSVVYHKSQSELAAAAKKSCWLGFFGVVEPGWKLDSAKLFLRSHRKNVRDFLSLIQHSNNSLFSCPPPRPPSMSNIFFVAGLFYLHRNFPHTARNAAQPGGAQLLFNTRKWNHHA